jgi:pimeloyl-ACP methyl ester carboxylesterase
MRDAFLDDLRHPSRTAARAAAHDFWLFTRPGDINLATLRTPAHIWHGAEDRNVPVAHARVIAARCPAAKLHIVDGGGHMLLSRLDEILATASAPRRPREQSRPSTRHVESLGGRDQEMWPNDDRSGE